MSDIKRTSPEARRTMKNQGETSPLRADAESIDIPEDFWDNAKVRHPSIKKTVKLYIDSDVLRFFKQDGRDYQTRINSVLKSYVDAQMSAPHG